MAKKSSASKTSPAIRKTLSETITLVVPGRPVLKSNYKATNRAGAYFNKAAAYEETVAKIALCQLQQDGFKTADLPLFPKPARVAIDIIVTVKSNAGDATNYPKSICDALQGIVYDNDSQIVVAHIVKLAGEDYRPIDGGDGAIIVISPESVADEEIASYQEIIEEAGGGDNND